MGAPEMGWDLETGVASMAALAKAAAVAELAAAPKAAVAETPSSPSLAGIFFSQSAVSRSVVLTPQPHVGRALCIRKAKRPPAELEGSARPCDQRGGCRSRWVPT